MKESLKYAILDLRKIRNNDVMPIIIIWHSIY